MKEIHRPARRNFRKRRTIIKVFVAKRVIGISTTQTINDGYRYILLVTNCYPKYLYLEAVKNETAEEVTRAFKNTLKNSRYYLINLQTDNEREFYNYQFRELMKRHKINHHFIYSVFVIFKVSLRFSLPRLLVFNDSF